MSSDERQANEDRKHDFYEVSEGEEEAKSDQP
jgi:hypothetical protein